MSTKTQKPRSSLPLLSGLCAALLLAGCSGGGGEGGGGGSNPGTGGSNPGTGATGLPPTPLETVTLELLAPSQVQDSQPLDVDLALRTLNGSLVAQRSIELSVNGQLRHLVQSSGNGFSRVTLPAPHSGPALFLSARFAGDSLYQPANSQSVNVSVVIGPTPPPPPPAPGQSQLIVTAPSSISASDDLNLIVELRGNGQPLNGRMIEMTELAQATPARSLATDFSGRAQFLIPGPHSAASFNFNFRFAGEAQYSASTQSHQVTLTQDPGIVDDSEPVTGGAFPETPVSAPLTEHPFQPAYDQRQYHAFLSAQGTAHLVPYVELNDVTVAGSPRPGFASITLSFVMLGTNANVLNKYQNSRPSSMPATLVNGVLDDVVVRLTLPTGERLTSVSDAPGLSPGGSYQAHFEIPNAYVNSDLQISVSRLYPTPNLNIIALRFNLQSVAQHLQASFGGFLIPQAKLDVETSIKSFVETRNASLISIGTNNRLLLDDAVRKILDLVLKVKGRPATKPSQAAATDKLTLRAAIAYSSSTTSLRYRLFISDAPGGFQTGIKTESFQLNPSTAGEELRVARSALLWELRAYSQGRTNSGLNVGPLGRFTGLVGGVISLDNMALDYRLGAVVNNRALIEANKYTVFNTVANRPNATDDGCVMAFQLQGGRCYFRLRVVNGAVTAVLPDHLNSAFYNTATNIGPNTSPLVLPSNR